MVKTDTRRRELARALRSVTRRQPEPGATRILPPEWYAFADAIRYWATRANGVASGDTVPLGDEDLRDLTGRTFDQVETAIVDWLLEHEAVRPLTA